MRQAILDGDIQNYDVERGFTRHVIEEGGDGSGGIVIRLRQQCILNHIRMLLWDRDLRSYSYYIEVSMDQDDWVRVVDHTKYQCRSWQNIFFPQRVVKYIKIVGTHNTVNRMFHVVAVQAYYTHKEFTLDPTWGLLVPRENVATIDLSACVIEGVSRSRNALIDGKTGGYDWDSGYTCHQLGSGAIVVQLAQPYVVASMRLLLWDCDDRSYSYYIEVSTNQRSWEMVCNRSREKCKSWQSIKFPPIPVVYIRIVGTDNTANEVFHCVHFECPAQIDEDGKVTDTSLMNNKESADGSTPGPSSAMKQQQSPIVVPAILSAAQMPRSRSPSLLLIDEEPIIVAAVNERSQNEDEEIRRFENLLLDQPEVEEIAHPPPSQDNLNENDLIE